MERAQQPHAGNPMQTAGVPHVLQREWRGGCCMLATLVNAVLTMAAAEVEVLKRMLVVLGWRYGKGPMAHALPAVERIACSCDGLQCCRCRSRGCGHHDHHR